MEIKDVLLKLRTEKGISQDELVEKIFLEGQAQPLHRSNMI